MRGRTESSPMPAWPTTQVSRRKSITPQMFSRHGICNTNIDININNTTSKWIPISRNGSKRLTRTPSIHPILWTPFWLGRLSFSSSAGLSSGLIWWAREEPHRLDCTHPSRLKQQHDEDIGDVPMVYRRVRPHEGRQAWVFGIRPGCSSHFGSEFLVEAPLESSDAGTSDIVCRM